MQKIKNGIFWTLTRIDRIRSCKLIYLDLERHVGITRVFHRDPVAKDSLLVLGELYFCDFELQVGGRA